MDGTGKESQGPITESFMGQAKGRELLRPEGKAASGIEYVTEGVQAIKKRR